MPLRSAATRVAARGGRFFVWGAARRRKTAHAPGAVPAGGQRAVQLLLAAGEPVGAPAVWHLYAVAASACVLLLAYYASHMLGGLTRGVPLGRALRCCMACCTCCCSWSRRRWWWGDCTLPLVLAAVMVLTRKVNWYGLSQGGAPRPAPPVQRPQRPHGGCMTPLPPPRAGPSTWRGRGLTPPQHRCADRRRSGRVQRPVDAALRSQDRLGLCQAAGVLDAAFAPLRPGSDLDPGGL